MPLRFNMRQTINLNSSHGCVRIKGWVCTYQFPIYKTTNSSSLFFGLDRFMVLINGVKNYVYGVTIYTIYKFGLSGF